MVFVGRDNSLAGEKPVEQPVRLQLQKPASRSLIHTLTPTFQWKPIRNPDVEYRIRVAEWNGKPVLDEWVDKQTQLTIADTSIFEDLKVYLWSVTAYKGTKTWQSDTYSFCIDLNISVDLEILDVRLKKPADRYAVNQDVSFDVKILNCGPVPCFDATLKLSNGNPDENFRKQHLPRKSIWQDSIRIDQLGAGKSMTVTMHGQILPGLNRFYVRIKTRQDFVDIYQANNVKAGPVIQSIPQQVPIHGLLVLYATTADVEARNMAHLDRLQRFLVKKYIDSLQVFLWDRTRMLALNMDTLNIHTPLTMADFRTYSEESGMLLQRKRILNDLEQHQINMADYDFIYAFYPWGRKFTNWVGYHGYVFDPPAKLQNIPVAAQPIGNSSMDGHLVIIHEMMHILESMSAKSSDAGTLALPSPDQRERNTTFTSELDYYSWILETLPSQQWLALMKSSSAAEIAGESPLPNYPNKFELQQNYPNPFNNNTYIRYTIPTGDAAWQLVTLKIYNVLGTCVKTLVHDYKQAGRYTVRWDGTNEAGDALTSGIYLYRLSVGRQSEFRKLLLLK